MQEAAAGTAARPAQGDSTRALGCATCVLCVNSVCSHTGPPAAQSMQGTVPPVLCMLMAKFGAQHRQGTLLFCLLERSQAASGCFGKYASFLKEWQTPTENDRTLKVSVGQFRKSSPSLTFLWVVGIMKIKAFNIAQKIFKSTCSITI